MAYCHDGCCRRSTNAAHPPLIGSHGAGEGETTLYCYFGCCKVFVYAGIPPTEGAERMQYMDDLMFLACEKAYYDELNGEVVQPLLVENYRKLKEEQDKQVAVMIIKQNIKNAGQPSPKRSVIVPTPHHCYYRV